MPVFNNFFGGYKVLGINTSSAFSPIFQFVISKSYNQNDNMQAEPKNYVQGSIKAKILDIGRASADLTIVAPILVGGGSIYDGRVLLNSKLSSIISNPGIASLPIISGATISISENESTVTIKMKSDGDPNNMVNTVQISDDPTNAGYISVNNALTSPTRVASFYDFKVNLGGFQYYVIDGTLNVEILTKEEVFLGSINDSTGNTFTTQYADPNYASGYNDQGLQFPYIGVGGIKITGEGTAAVALSGTTGQAGFMGTNIKFLSTSAGIAKSDLWQNSNVTLQKPGQVITGPGTFAVEIYTGSAWTDLLSGSGINLNSAIINSRTFNLTPDLMTAKFNFIAYIT